MADKENTTDVFDGEIPTDIGKKSQPIWMKIGGLVVLVGLMGTAAYMLESDSGNDAMEAGRSEVAEALSGKLPSSETGTPSDADTSNEIDIGMSDVQSDSETSSEPPTASSIDPLNDAEPGDTPDTDMMVDEGNAITITPAQDEPVMESSEAVDTELRENVDEISTRLEEIESAQSDRISIVKSGIDLQTQSIDKLSSLVESLDDLKKELSELKSAPVQSANAKEPSTSKNADNRKPSEDAQPIEEEETAELELVGIDSWGGERFAQIEYENKIHLLAENETIGEWRIQTVGRQQITVTDNEGESFELRI